MSLRLASYALCFEGERVLLVRHRSGNWTLPGGRVEHGEDPYDAVIREVAEETGYRAAVDRLLGVDSRIIPAAERAVPGGPDHHHVGIFYRVQVIGGSARAEPDGDTVEVAWTPMSHVALLRRSSLVDVGLDLAATRPANGHVGHVPIGGLIQH